MTRAPASASTPSNPCANCCQVSMTSVSVVAAESGIGVSGPKRGALGVGISCPIPAPPSRVPKAGQESNHSNYQAGLDLRAMHKVFHGEPFVVAGLYVS